MTIFWRLVLGHFVADYTFQTNWVASVKRDRWWGMVLHSIMHPLAWIVFTYPYLQDVWAFGLSGWRCIGILFATHYLQDVWRVYTIRRFGTSDGTLHFAWDQVVHFGAIFALFPFAALGTWDRTFWFPEKWPVLGTLLVLATHFNTVFVYFLEKDLRGGQYPGSDEKYITMGERLILGLTMLLPGGWWVPAAAAAAGAGAYVRRKRILEYSWFGWAVGGGLAVASGAAARFLLTV